MRLRTLDFQGIHNATLRILYRTGLRVHGIGDRGMAATLAGAGLMVEGETVRFPPEVLEGLVSQAPREVHLHAPGGQAVTLSQEAPLVMADGTGIFVMEEGGETRPSASRDVHRAVILQNSLSWYPIAHPPVPEETPWRPPWCSLRMALYANLRPSMCGVPSHC
ncbi:MAG: trimethylamine methyltransferase family protein [Bacillota bacterium]